VININIGYVLHRLATLHPWHGDRQTDDRRRP